MTDEARPMPEIVDRTHWQQARDRLLTREKAHTREGDAIAAARRRMPMVEVDAATPVAGERGEVALRDCFDGRSQLVAYFHMWHAGRPWPEQCEGCTFFTSHAGELSYLHARDVTYATFCHGDYEESVRYRDFMGWTMPWYSVRGVIERILGEPGFAGYVCFLRDGDRVFETYRATDRGTEAGASSYGLLDLTVYGRQERWEDSPAGWPQPCAQPGEQFRLGGRPTAQWSRVAEGQGT